MTSLPRTDCRRAVTLGPAVMESRRALGPVAWVLLELLAENSISRAGATVSKMSIRGLAAQINLTKDTVARGLRRLQHAELVTRVDTRRTDGRFGRGCYVLNIPDDLLNVRTTPFSTAPQRRSTTDPSQRAEQLTLLDLSNEATCS